MGISDGKQKIAEQGNDDADQRNLNKVQVSFRNVCDGSALGFQITRRSRWGANPTKTVVDISNLTCSACHGRLNGIVRLNLGIALYVSLFGILCLVQGPSPRNVFLDLFPNPRRLVANPHSLLFIHGRLWRKRFSSTRRLALGKRLDVESSVISRNVDTPLSLRVTKLLKLGWTDGRARKEHPILKARWT